MIIPEFLSDPLVKYYISSLAVAFPVARIFMRAGFKFWYAGVLVVPYVGFILCLALLARLRWKVA